MPKCTFNTKNGFFKKIIDSDYKLIYSILKKLESENFENIIVNMTHNEILLK